MAERHSLFMLIISAISRAVVDRGYSFGIKLGQFNALWIISASLCDLSCLPEHCKKCILVFSSIFLTQTREAHNFFLSNKTELASHLTILSRLKWDTRGFEIESLVPNETDRKTFFVPVLCLSKPICNPTDSFHYRFKWAVNEQSRGTGSQKIIWQQEGMNPRPPSS